MLSYRAYLLPYHAQGIGEVGQGIGRGLPKLSARGCPTYRQGIACDKNSPAAHRSYRFDDGGRPDYCSRDNCLNQMPD